mgnify:CR=1 FL=1
MRAIVIWLDYQQFPLYRYFFTVFYPPSAVKNAHLGYKKETV